jgi:hypothetical protein
MPKTKSGTTLKTDDGLTLDFTDGQVKKLLWNGKAAPLSGPGGFAATETLTPDGRVRDHGVFEGQTSSVRGGVRFEGAIPRAALELTATLRGGRHIAIEGEVRDTSGVDRALSVSFTLPLKLAQWKWENTAAVSRTIRRGRTYPSKPEDMIYIGIKGDGFADEIPDVFPVRTNKLPFSCVCRGSQGLALAMPIHEPRVFLISADESGYRITFSLGVTPLTRKFPSKASFKLLLYPVDPAWGIRSAAERYQRFFPELYRVRLNRHGNCGGLHKDHLPEDDLRERGWAFQENDYQWTDGEMAENVAALAAKYDVVSFHWRGPWYWFHEAPGDITRDAQLALMKAQAEGRAPGAHGSNNQLCGCPDDISAKAAYNSYIENGEGKLERIFFCYPEASCWLMPGNMDPNLPKPNRSSLAEDWQFRYRKLWKKKGFRGPTNVAYDALDDFSGFRRLNFRRAHLTEMDIPATFDPASGRVCQVKGFGDWAWARRHAKLVRDDGGHIMANCNLEHAMMFCAPSLDVIFRERRLADNDEEKLSVHRMLCGAKPFVFIGGSREPDTSAQWQAMADRALLFGMAPGETHLEKSLLAHMPRLQSVAGAGWQAIPYAQAEGLWVERFGQRPNRMYFTARNTGAKTVRSRLTIDLSALGLAKDAKRLTVRSLDDQGDLPAHVVKNGLSVTIEVKPRRTVALSLQRK